MREDGLDRRTDDPDESGGASPTVVTSRQDGGDLSSGDGRDTRPVSFIMPSPLMPRISGDAPAIPSAWNAPAVGSIAYTQMDPLWIGGGRSTNPLEGSLRHLVNTPRARAHSYLAQQLHRGQEQIPEQA